MDAEPRPSRGRVLRLLRRTASVVAAAVLAAAFVLWRTWPLAAKLDAGAPRPDFDWLYAAWTLAWQVHALVRDASPAMANIYHPTPDALYYGPLCTGLLPIFAPLYLLGTDPLHATKLSYLIALTLTATSVHIVVQSWTRSWTAGAVAIATLFACNELVAMPSNAPQWAALAFFAPIVWALGRASIWRGAGVLALLVAAQCVTEPLYVAPSVLAVVILAGSVRLFDAHTRPTGLRIVTSAMASIALILPIMRGYLRVRAANPELFAQSVWIPATWGSSAQMALFLSQFIAVNSYREVPFVFILPSVALAVVAQRSSGSTAVPRLVWLDASLLAVVPFAVAIALPLVALLPGLESLTALRVPGRLILGGFIGVALLAGLAWNELLHAARRRGNSGKLLLAAVLLLLLWCHVRLPAIPIVVSREPGTPALATMLLRLGVGPVLEIPANAPTNAGKASANAWAMHRSLSHWRPILNGYASYWPAGWPEQMADAARLPDRDALARLVRSTGLTAIVVRLSELPHAERGRWQMPLVPAAPGLVPLLITNEFLLFKVDEEQLPFAVSPDHPR